MIFKRQHNKPPFLALNPIWLIITMVVFFVLVKLAWWQSDRASVKEERLTRIIALTQQKAIALAELEQLQQQLEEGDTINDFPVTVQGEFVNDVVFLLDNQMFNGKFGYRVLQLVKSNKYAVLVNLGWHKGDRTRQQQPNIPTLTGQVNLTGNVRIIEQGIQLQAQTLALPWPVLIQQIELDKIAVLLGVELLPFVIYLDENESLGYQKNWQPVVMPPEKHKAYAFQWLSLAMAWLILMSWAARKAQKNK